MAESHRPSVRWLAKVLVLLVVPFVLAIGPGASVASLETSVAQLVINEQPVSDNFELVDTGETVLLPLRAMAKWLDGRVELDPQVMTANVTRTWDQATGSVDLKRQALTMAGQDVPFNPGAQAGAGDFFLPVSAIQSLFDAKVEWDANAQALLLTCDRELTAFRKEEKKKADEAKEPERKPERAPFLTLGSVQYMLTYSETSDTEKWPHQDELKLDVHLQAGGVPVDVAGRAENVSHAEREWEMDRATATYYGTKALIVAGDTTFNLGRVIENANLRGFRFSSPPGWTAVQLEAYTVLEGWVRPGSTVELTVNDYFLGRVITEDGHYRFERVPLQITTGNNVVVTVTEDTGRRYTETRSIAATPRLLPSGTLNAALGAGWVRGDSKQWSTFLQGASAYHGLAPWLTVGGEVARRRQLEESAAAGQPVDLAGNVAVALRLRDNLVCSLDWMVSRPEEAGSDRPSGRGVDLAALFQVGRTAWQGVVFYREPGLLLFSDRTEPDLKGYRLIAEYALSDQFSVQGSYQRSQPVSVEAFDPTDQLGTVLRWIPSARQRLVLDAKRVVKESDQAKLNYELNTPRTSIQLELGADWTEMGVERPSPTGMQSVLTLNRALNEDLLLSLSQTGSADWPVEGSGLRKNLVEGEVAWYPGMYRLAVTGSVEDLSVADGLGSASQKSAGVDLSRSFGPVTAGVGHKVTQDFDSALTGQIITNSVHVNVAPRRGWSALLRLEQSTPTIGSGYADTLKAKCVVRAQLKGGLQLGLEGQGERRRWEEGDYWVGLTISQGLGFAGGEVRGFPAEEGRPMSYVVGTVYLDLNRNGQQDAGEKTLEGIPVRLSGRRAKTGRNGRFLFEFVEPGTYTVGVDPEALPADYSSVTESKLFRLPLNANYSQDFGVALNGTIEGYVFVDYDNDGKLAPGDPRHPWVRVLLDGKTETFTDEAGGFSFGNVDLGRHVLSVDPKSLPEGTLTPQPINIEITEEDLDAWDVMVPLRQTAQY